MRNYRKYRFAFLAGSLGVILIFTVVPLLYGFYLSLHSGRGGELSFAGLQNYRRLVRDDTVIQALRNTLGFTFVLTPGVLSLSLVLANCIHHVRSEKMKGFYSVVLFLPSITSPAAYAFFFKRLFAVDGFLNKLSLRFDPQAEFVNYLLTPKGARLAIIIVCLWAWTGYYTMLLLSAMQSVDSGIYKAAKIDGLSRGQTLLKVTLPIIWPVASFCCVLLSCGIFQLFAEIMIMSKGGPEKATITLAYYIYQLCFEYVPQFGYAAAAAMLIFILSGILGYVQLKAGEGRM